MWLVIATARAFFCVEFCVYSIAGYVYQKIMVVSMNKKNIKFVVAGTALLFITGVVLVLPTMVLADNEPSFTFAPAPANLAVKKSGFGIGVNSVTIDIDNADSVTARTLLINYKTVSKNHDSSTKLHAYQTNIDMPYVDNAYAVGFGFSHTKGSLDGVAGVLGFRLDSLNFYYQDYFSDMVMFSLDLGVQNHIKLKNELYAIPWFRFTTMTGEFDSGLANADAQQVNLTAMTYGADLMFNGISLGAMYQKNKNSQVSSLSFSYDF